MEDGAEMRLILLLLISFPVYAYEFNGEKWKSPLEWYMGDGCGPLVKYEVEKALDEIAPLGHSYKGSHPEVDQDWKSVIYCSKELGASGSSLRRSNLKMSESYILSESGAIVGNTKWWHANGEIVEFDIWLQEDLFLGLGKIVRHELLHGFGLQHSLNENAIMFWSPSTNNLHIDDLAGLSMLYDCKVKADQDANIFIPWVEWLGQNFSAFLMLEDGYQVYDVEEGCLTQ